MSSCNPDEAYEVSTGDRYNPRRRVKYNVAPKENRTYEGAVFDSKVEMEYYKYLAERRNGGDIVLLKTQHNLDFILGGVKMFTLRLDFHFITNDGKSHYHDVKGMDSTPLFRLKKKLIEHQHDITIHEVRWDRKCKGWIIGKDNHE